MQGEEPRSPSGRRSLALRRLDDQRMEEILARLELIEQNVEKLLAIHRGILLFAHFGKWIAAVGAGIATIWAVVHGNRA